MERWLCLRHQPYSGLPAPSAVFGTTIEGSGESRACTATSPFSATRSDGNAPLKELSNKPAATQRLSDGNTPLTMKLLVVAVSVKVANLVMESNKW